MPRPYCVARPCQKPMLCLRREVSAQRHTRYRIGHAVTVAEGLWASACRAPQDPDRGLEPIGRGARAGADAVRGQSKSPQSPLRPAISGKNRSPIALGDCLIEPIFAMNCAVSKTFSGLSV